MKKVLFAIILGLCLCACDSDKRAQAMQKVAESCEPGGTLSLTLYMNPVWQSVTLTCTEVVKPKDK